MARSPVRYVVAGVLLAVAIPCAGLGTVLGVRTTLYEPYSIPAGSMAPALKIGTYVLVSRFAYDLQPFGVKVATLGEPARGDVVVFRYPPEPDVTYIKRVIALPGETVEVRDGVVHVDGVAFEREEAGAYTYVDSYCGEEELRRFRERLGDVEIEVLQSSTWRRMADYGPETVPAGHLFVMGDNRDNSADSRVWGFVPRDNLIGRMETVWLELPPSCG